MLKLCCVKLHFLCSCTFVLLLDGLGLHDEDLWTPVLIPAVGAAEVECDCLSDGTLGAILDIATTMTYSTHLRLFRHR